MTITQSDTATMNIIGTTAGRAIAVAVPRLESAASTSTSSTFYQSTITENSNAITWSEYEIQTQIGSNYTISNLSATQTLTAGVVAPVGDGGLGRIRVTDGVVSNILKTDTTKRGGQSFREFVGYTAGTVAKYLYDQVSPLFDATPDVEYFSTYNHATSTYTRNAACWAASINLSCVAVASSFAGGWTRQRGGTLITARHILLARHYPLSLGDQIRFTNAGGTVETRTIIGLSSAATVADLLVATLSAAVTVASPCAIAGEWITQGRTVVENYARWYSGGIAIHTDQNARVYAGTIGQTINLVGSPSWATTANGTVYAQCDTSGSMDHSSYGAIPSAYAALRHTPIPGDSGQPSFVIKAGAPVLLWTWHTPAGGPPVYMHGGAVLNSLIAVADADAVTRGQLGSPTGLTVTVASDPTIPSITADATDWTADSTTITADAT